MKVISVSNYSVFCDYQSKYYCVLLLQFPRSHRASNVNKVPTIQKRVSVYAYDASAIPFSVPVDIILFYPYENCFFAPACSAAVLKIPHRLFLSAAARITGSCYRWLPDIIDLNWELTFQIFVICNLFHVRYLWCQTVMCHRLPSLVTDTDHEWQDL
jgi:hypothetical protein